MIHQKRRQTLLKQFKSNALLIISTNSEQLRSGDVHYPFCPNSDFYYLTGFIEPEAFVVISQNNCTLFLRPKDKKREIWEGECLGVKHASRVLGVDCAYSINDINKRLPRMLFNKALYFDAKPSKIDEDILAVLQGKSLESLAPPLHEMRLFKDDTEIALMQKAADVSVKAHILAMQTTQPGMFEFEVQAVFDGFFKRHNTEHAYPPIVAGGKSACVLHYVDNNKTLNKGDLLLIDAGCEVEGYAADITRTFPVNGKFSKAQAQIYQLVLDAQLAAIACIKPGVSTKQPHKITQRIIKDGLITLGVLATNGNLKQFFMHGTGHYLGLDVHDVGTYKQNGRHRTFEPGMVTTVEPGIYIRKDAKINPIYWNIGVRIEDDVLITQTGNTVLTGALVKEINEIESLMK